MHRHLCPTAAETRPVSVCNMNRKLSASGCRCWVVSLSAPILTAKHCMKACISSIHSKFFLPLLLTFKGTRPVPMLYLRCQAYGRGCGPMHACCMTCFGTLTGLLCPPIVEQSSADFSGFLDACHSMSHGAEIAELQLVRNLLLRRASQQQYDHTDQKMIVPC